MTTEMIPPHEVIVKILSDATYHGVQHGAPDCHESVTLVNRSKFRGILGGKIGPKVVVTRCTDVAPLGETYTSETSYVNFKKMVSECRKIAKKAKKELGI